MAMVLNNIIYITCTVFFFAHYLHKNQIVTMRGVRNSIFFIIMGIEQMMTSDDNGGRSVNIELIYNWMM
jgi:hypothetical protein